MNIICLTSLLLTEHMLLWFLNFSLILVDIIDSVILNLLIHILSVVCSILGTVTCQSWGQFMDMKENNNWSTPG